MFYVVEGTGLASLSTIMQHTYDYAIGTYILTYYIVLCTPTIYVYVDMNVFLYKCCHCFIAGSTEGPY